MIIHNNMLPSCPGLFPCCYGFIHGSGKPTRCFGCRSGFVTPLPSLHLLKAPPSRACCLSNLHNEVWMAVLIRACCLRSHHNKGRMALHDNGRMTLLRPTALQPHKAFSQKTAWLHHHTALVCITVLTCVMVLLLKLIAVSKLAWRKLTCITSG